MRRSDDGLRAIVRKHLLPRGFVVTPVETGGTTAGVGDIYWTHEGAQARGWVECKATDGWGVEFRPHQLGFCRREVASGGRTVVAVRARGVGSGGPGRDALWVVRGSAATLLASEGLRALDGHPDLLGRWYGGPRRWDWAAVAATLLAAPDYCGRAGASTSVASSGTAHSLRTPG